MNFSNLSTINIRALNILVILFPVVFITGNLLININVFLVCILGVFAYRDNIFDLKQLKHTLPIFLFFILIIIFTGLNSELIGNDTNYLKSFLYLRYYIFLIVLRCMVSKNDLDIKKLMICCLVITTFIALDCIFQSILGKNIFGFETYGKYGTVGKNIFGLESQGRYNSGIFGKELIAGSYLQRFSLFGLVCFPFISNKFDKKKFYIIFILLSIFFSGILVSGNRMPLIMFILSISLIIFFIKELRLILLTGLVFCSLIFTTSTLINENIKNHYISFYLNSINTVVKVKKFIFKEYPELESQKKDDKFFWDKYRKGKDSKRLKEKYELINFGSGHAIVFLTAYDVWSEKIFTGNGLKSFRLTCKTKLHLPNRVCSSHPHNYYLELLNDTGLIGTLVLIIGVIFLLRKKSYNFKKFSGSEKLLFICIFILICTEFFPLKSSGGFFTTSNSSFIFFLLGLLSGFKSKFALKD